VRKSRVPDFGDSFSLSIVIGICDVLSSLVTMNFARIGVANNGTP